MHYLTSGRTMHSLRRNESGFALASVMFVGVVMMLLTAIIVMRAASQGNVEVNDAQWEQALHVAEGGMDDFLAELAQEDDPDAVTTGHTASLLSDKDAIIAVAEAYAQANPDELLSTPEGEAIVLKPSDDSIIYAVGFTPSLAFNGHQARVIEIDYDFSVLMIPNFGANHALLSGGDIDLSSASSGIYDPDGDDVSVHANGELDNHSNFTIDGCATSDEDDSAVGDNCPDPLPATFGYQVIPDVDPTMVHGFATYDLCQGGIIMQGPSYGGGPAPDPVPAPCSGSTVGSLSGVSGKLTAGVWNWDIKKGAPEGVYYVDGGDIAVTTDSKDGQQEITVIAAAADDDTECSNTKSSGNIKVTAGADVTSHPTAGGLTLIAQGDVKFLGNATVEGLILAHEQIDFRGGTGNGGAVIAEHHCDHPGSPVTGVSEVSGGAGITYGGSVITPFEGYSDEVALTIIGRKEA